MASDVKDMNKKSEGYFDQEEITAAMMNSPIGIYIVRDSKFVFSNTRFQEITGLTEDELKSIHPLDIVYPEDRERVRTTAINMLKGERKDSYQFRALDKAGDFRWILENVASIHFNGKRAVMGYFVDITESEGIKASFMSSPVGIYIIRDGRFIFTNPMFQKITGYTEKELLSKNPLDLVIEEDRSRVRKRAAQMLKWERSDAYQYRVLDKAGDEKWIMESVSSVQYQGSRAALGYFMDVTDSL